MESTDLSGWVFGFCFFLVGFSNAEKIISSAVFTRVILGVLIPHVVLCG